MPKFRKYVQVDYAHETCYYDLRDSYDDDDISRVSIVEGWGVEYTDEFGMPALHVFDSESKAIEFSKEVGGN